MHLIYLCKKLQNAHVHHGPWHYEKCAICGREQRLAWGVSDELWQAVTDDLKDVACLECFLRLADYQQVPIKLNQITLYGFVLQWEDKWENE
jgi:hypothetical protein